MAFFLAYSQFYKKVFVVAQEGQKAGNVYLSGDELQVSFKFSKVRFTAIKSIKGAYYNKELKRWCMPVTSLNNLLSSKLFSEKVMNYGFDKEEAEKKAMVLDELGNEAKQEIEKNPFSVSEDLIAKTEIDCVFRSSNGGLRAFLKKRSSAKKILEKYAGVLFLKNELSFFIPTLLVRKIICELRDNKLSFAVSENTGAELKIGASLRQEITANNYLPNMQELRTAMLVPYFSLNRNSGKACIQGALAEQLFELFPEIRGNLARERFASSLSMEQVANVLIQSEKKKTKVWLPREIFEIFNQDETLYYLTQNPEFSFLPVLINLLNGKQDRAWVCDDTGAGLLIKDESEISDVINGKNLTVHQQFPNLNFIKPREREFADFYKSISDVLGEIPESFNFTKYYQGLLKRVALRERCKKFNTMRDCDLDIHNQELKTSLFPHQRVAVKWLLETKEALLGDDMGLGKTLSVLSTFQELLQRQETSFLLIVAPNSLVLNWYREAKRWVENLRFLILPDSPKAKEASLKELRQGDFYQGLIINYEKIRLDYVYPSIIEMCKNRNVMLALDESQRVKNPTSKVCKVLREIAPFCKRRVLLSGTPAPRDLADIWSQMLLIDGGERFGTNYYNWLTSVAEVGNQWSEYAVRRFLPDKVEATIERVQEVLLRRRKGDVIDLPEKLFSVRDLELSGEQEKRYEEVRKELLLRVKDIDGNTSVKQIESILEEYLRAVQIASNPRIIDEEWQGEPVKFVELDEIVEEVVAEHGEKLVIWTNFRHNVKELVQRYAKYNARPFMGDVSTKERDKTIKDFQDKDSDVKILVAIPAAGGVGITLTAAQTAVYLEKTWNLEHWQQSIDRLHRIGQNGTVTIISLQACPVDELIASNLAKKMRIQARLLGDSKNKSKINEEEESLLPTKEELLSAVSRKITKEVLAEVEDKI